MGEHRDDRGLALGVTVCVLAALGLVITALPRFEPQQWGATIVVGVLGPIGGVLLAVLAWRAITRATRRPATTVARVALALSVAGVLSALSLWGV
ncbi:hypothetical protein MUN78_05635 [Leucobacter allii]|uniref:Uncharacterized protein n=1 Tax=Leucobacter allii TaxID=2932247 RepID=A0ABY4FPW1_9MICO|nr:hypothetical protein [Leucobacter allii]UOQ58322.1 hypothetical protein MUN78_05635 [Leucobacter allii]